mgnify:CR=1 FL=1
MRYARTGQDVRIPVEAVSDTSYLEYTSTVENLTAYGSDDGAESVALTGVTAVWDAGLGMFRITIPANQCPAEGHMFYIMVDWTGIIDLKAEFYMTNAETNIAAIKAITDLLTLANINTEIDTAISDAALATAAGLSGLNNISEAQVLAQVASALSTYDGPTKTEMDSAFSTTNGLIGALSIGESVGTEHVIPPAYYRLDASENTITLLTPYNGITVEQISLIYDLTLGAELYNSLNPRKHVSFDPDTEMEIDIEIADGVITFYESLTSMADTDKIRIIANIASISP